LTHTLRGLAVAALIAFLSVPQCAQPPPPGADPSAAAAFTITNQVLRPADKVPPLGANDYGRCGAVEWARNNFVQNAGNEPIYWKNLHRAIRCGDHWFEIDGGGVSWWDLWASGFLSGAEVRIYRIVDADGKPVVGDNGLDMSRADHVAFVGRTQVLPEGSPGFPDGGWVVTEYGDVHPNAWIRGRNLTVTDALAVENGRTYWYAVTAIGANGKESALSAEVSAGPRADIDTPPHLLIARDQDRFPDTRSGQGLRFELRAAGGAGPLTWSIAEGALPVGLKLDPATGVIDGVPTQEPPADTPLRITVSDARGRSDARTWVLNATPAKGEGDEAPQPPTNVSAVAGNGCVTISWQPSPSPNVQAYRLKRSTKPLAEQMNRVYLPEDGPKLERMDYIVLERKFDPFDMRYVHPRVRGIGNPMDSPNWHWRGDPKQVRFALVPHPQPIPKEMTDPGETCLQAEALGPNETSINQFVFIGTDLGNNESIWYGQLEPGKQYHLDVWLRQEGLANRGAVTFSYGRGYPEIQQTFAVTSEWRRFTYDFTGGERPTKLWHFGHQFSFTGPGKLWMDNCRIFRVDRPEDLTALYVPSATVLGELLASSPESGPKGAQRCWVLKRDSKMADLLSWYGNSQVRPDWSTSVGDTVEMTVPCALEFCRRTGDRPADRVVPWLVIQHILHTEDEWLALVEYLAAPYDPRTDTPAAKPWAYRRYQQRGIGTPWIDEFWQLVVEFGNETWHNGVFDDWLGFSTRNAVWQGGPEYGLFCRYLIGNMKRSPYWASQKLDGRLRFALGDGYLRRDVGGGKRLTYGEEAMERCPEADLLVHANYVGPKWETGDSSSENFDDHGVQATLLAYLTGNQADFRESHATREAMAAAGHAYDLAAYESGPSGYKLPGQGTPQQVEVNERYGKSLAMAVAALDAWLGAYGEGWTYQNFLGYGQGQYWNSHTWFSEGFRPYPGWQALQLRNRFARGDYMAVEATSEPSMQFGARTYPLIGVYALREGDRWSVFVLSRKLDGSHDGVDFGDGATPVSLSLPFRQASKITLHRMTGDPREGNRKELKVQIESLDIPPQALANGTLKVGTDTGGLATGMPPGSIYLYVFEGGRN